MYTSKYLEKNLKNCKKSWKRSLLWWKPSNRCPKKNLKKIKNQKKNQKEKNTKKLKNKEKCHWWKPGNRCHSSKKRKFCQEGKNLVNRCLLFLNAPSCSASSGFLYSFFHAFTSYFSFLPSIMYPWIKSCHNSRATPSSLIESLSW